MKKRVLGKGLDALLLPQTTQAKGGQSELRMIPVDLIQRGPYQPRTTITRKALDELAASIRAQGVVQPIIARVIDGGKRYEIIAGERRWRASQLAGLHEIPVIVKTVSDQAAMCLALIENIQREDLNAIEEARALARLLKEFKMTHEAVAKAVGRSRSAVTNLLRLLELHTDVRQLLETGAIEMGHGRAILGLPAKQQVEAVKKIVKKGLSVRATERLVKTLKSAPTTTKKRPDPNLTRLQTKLSNRLGAPVHIKPAKKHGTGKLEITYHSLDELDGILERIK